jgi:Carbon-nitrogen hydrolase
LHLYLADAIRRPGFPVYLRHNRSVFVPSHPSGSFGTRCAISLASYFFCVCLPFIYICLHLRDSTYVTIVGMLPTVKIAACHVSPVFLNSEKTTEKALRLTDEAASNGAHLVAFPESYIPGFPIWAGTGAPVDNPGLFARFVEASIYANGPEIAQIQTRCAERKVVVSIGFSERSHNSVGCLWNSNIMIGEDGKVLVHHRKICPT